MQEQGGLVYYVAKSCVCTVVGDYVIVRWTENEKNYVRTTEADWNE